MSVLVPCFAPKLWSRLRLSVKCEPSCWDSWSWTKDPPAFHCLDSVLFTYLYVYLCLAHLVYLYAKGMNCSFILSLLGGSCYSVPFFSIFYYSICIFIVQHIGQSRLLLNMLIWIHLIWFGGLAMGKKLSSLSKVSGGTFELQFGICLLHFNQYWMYCMWSREDDLFAW